MTVLEAIQKTADFFTPKGVDSPRLQAELLLAHVRRTHFSPGIHVPHRTGLPAPDEKHAVK